MPEPKAPMSDFSTGYSTAFVMRRSAAFLGWMLLLLPQGTSLSTAPRDVHPAPVGKTSGINQSSLYSNAETVSPFGVPSSPAPSTFRRHSKRTVIREAEQEAATCPICLEALSVTASPRERKKKGPINQAVRGLRRQFSRTRSSVGPSSSEEDPGPPDFYGCGHAAHRKCKESWDRSSGRVRCPLCNHEPPSESGDTAERSRNRDSDTAVREAPPHDPWAGDHNLEEPNYDHVQNYHPRLIPYVIPRHQLHAYSFMGPGPPPMVRLGPPEPGAGSYDMVEAERPPMMIPGPPWQTHGFMPGPYPPGLPFPPHQFGGPPYVVMMHSRHPASQSLDTVAPQLCLLFLVLVLFYYLR